MVKMNNIVAEAVSNIVIKDGNVGFTIEINPDQAGNANALKKQQNML